MEDKRFYLFTPDEWRKLLSIVPSNKKKAKKTHKVLGIECVKEEIK